MSGRAAFRDGGEPCGDYVIDLWADFKRIAQIRVKEAEQVTEAYRHAFRRRQLTGKSTTAALIQLDAAELREARARRLLAKVGD